MPLTFDGTPSNICSRQRMACWNNDSAQLERHIGGTGAAMVKGSSNTTKSGAFGCASAALSCMAVTVPPEGDHATKPRSRC